MTRLTFKLRITGIDRAALLKTVRYASEEARGRMAAFVRRRAQSSIKSSRVPSLPGRPPHSHKGWLKRGIYWAHDQATRTTVIGPTRDGAYKGVDVPHTLEHGGVVRNMKNYRRRLRRLGGSGEIRLKYPNLTFIRADYGLGPGRHRVGKDVVTYGRLLTDAQVARANRLNAQLYGPDVINATIEPRPYMGPAFEAEIEAGTMKAAITGAVMGPGARRSG